MPHAGGSRSPLPARCARSTAGARCSIWRSRTRAPSRSTCGSICPSTDSRSPRPGSTSTRRLLRSGATSSSLSGTGAPRLRCTRAKGGDPGALERAPGGELLREPCMERGIHLELLRVRRRIGIIEEPGERVDLLVEHPGIVEVGFRPLDVDLHQLTLDLRCLL